MLFILGIMATYMSQRRKLNNALGPPHLLQFIPMLSKPFFNQSLRRQRKIAIGHFKRRQIKHSYAIAVNSMNMRRFMLFRLKEHLHYDAIESCNFWHLYYSFFSYPHLHLGLLFFALPRGKSSARHRGGFPRLSAERANYTKTAAPESSAAVHLWVG